MKPVEKVLEAVDRYEKRHNGFWCICPAHDDHQPSLHVEEAEDGRALIICRAGCDQQRVMTALEARGLKSADLFPNDPQASTRPKTTRSTHKGREQLAKSFDIKDVSGVLHGIHERWENPETPDQKSFKWKLPNGKYSKGDINPAAMPLYNSELVASWPEGCRIVLVEGETPAEALWKRGIKAVGTVCGATLTPDRDVLEVLSGHEVIAWADNDASGLAHMRRCAGLLEGIAFAVRWFEWEDAPPKGDGADHPAITSGAAETVKELAQRLRTAPFFEADDDAEDTVSRFERIDLGEPIESGMEPAEMLVPDVLYAGSVHGIYSAGGKGKTFFALWLIKQVIEQDRPVMLLDQENGVRIISERLRSLGVSAEQARRNLYYYPFPSMPLEVRATTEFEEVLDEIKPALVVFDSWINFLANAGLDENSSVDIAQWADAYSQKARQRGMAILLLDHIPKEGNTARGSGRKLDYVDVMWELTKPQDFDRETVGRIDLRLKKDREGWMPWGVAFSVGGKDGSLIFGRTAFDKSTFVGDALRPKEKATLDALKSFGDAGVRYTPWLKEAEKRGLSSATFKRALDTLLRTDLVEKVMDKYFCKTPAKQKDHFGSKKAHEPNEPTAEGGKAHRAHTPRGEPSEPNQAEPSGEGVKSAFFEDGEKL